MEPKVLGKKLFELRDYTPIPLVILMLFAAKPTALSATIGMLCIGLGELIRVQSVAFIGSISRTRKSHTGDNLITGGPFGIVRNPLYVGNFFIVLGVCLYAGRAWLTILTVALFAVQYFYIVSYEESVLEEKFGEDYDSYRQRVPAWIPRALPRLVDMDWPNSYAQALKSEKRTLSAVLAIIILLLIVG